MIYSLQISRAVAALLVVLHHLGDAIGDAQYFSEPRFFIVSVR